MAASNAPAVAVAVATAAAAAAAAAAWRDEEETAHHVSRVSHHLQTRTEQFP